MSAPLPQRPAANPAATTVVDPARASRWVGVGRSVAADGRSAGAEAARQALRAAAPSDEPAKLLLAFVPRLRDPREVLAGIREVASGVPLAGCSTAGGISSHGADDDGVVLVAIGGGGIEASLAVARDAGEWRRTAGSAIASARPAGHLPHQVLLVFSDGTITDQEEILRGVYGVLGASVPVFGAADGGTFQVHGRGTGPDEVLTGAVIGVTLSSAGGIAIGVRHGWRPRGRPMTVTSARGGSLLELDDAPALDTYLDRLEAPEDAYRDAVAFTRFAVRHPVGVRRRHVVDLHDLSVAPDLERRSIGGRSSVPEGSVIWAMTAADDDLERSAADAVHDAITGLLPAPAAGLLVFGCGTQRDLIGAEGLRREVGRMAEQADGVPFGGFYGWGEIARTRGLGGFHSRTAVTLALA